MPRWRWVLKEMLARIWFRAAAISLLSVLLALGAALLAPLIPYEFSLKIGANAADNILAILASSMLAVTTFSLTAMVAAFSGAAQLGTPRATELLVEDSTAQYALSTFLGGFLFAIVGIIALSTGLYGEQGRAILLIGTILMIVWISITLLRWIGKLAHFGRLGDTIRRVEIKAANALSDYPGPLLTAGRADLEPPQDCAAIEADTTGYIAHVDREQLSDVAGKSGATIRLAAAAGQFVHPGKQLFWIEEGTIEDREGLVDAFAIHRQRDLDQDPRFGMVVLSEIASRALSPAVNDPGTAIAVLVAGQRVLDGFASDERPHEPLSDLVDVPLSFEEMVEDLILPVARDGAGMVEVGIQLQKMLGALAERFPGARGPLARLAEEARERAHEALSSERDRDRLDRAAGRAFP